MIDQSTADTLNKALDLAKQGVVAAFETVRQYAPFVWGLAQRQVVMAGVENALFALISGYLLIRYQRGLWRWANKESYNTDGLSIFGAVVATLAKSLTFVFTTLNAIDYIGNPGYWTMIKILDLIKEHK